MQIERLLTLGLAHGIDYRRMLDPPGSTTPAGRSVSWQDVMGAVAMVPKDQRAALYLKCAPHMVSAAELSEFCFGLLTTLQRYEAKGGKPAVAPRSRADWHTPAERALNRAQQRTFERQAAIVRTVLAEYQDPRICHACRGGGQVLAHIEGKGIVAQGCPKCDGKGWCRWSDNRRARAIGGDRNAYATRVAPAYEHTLKACTEQYRKGATAFKEALFGPADDESIPGVIERRLQARA